MIEVVENKFFNVLFLCTGNSARSIMAEVDHEPCRAGQVPRPFTPAASRKGKVNPYALDLLRKLHYDVDRAALEDLGRVFAVRTRRSSISSSPSATTPRQKPARFGRASR